MTIEEKKLDVSLVLHLRDWTQDNRLFDSRQLSRVIQCESGSSQIKEVKNAIQKAMDKYGPDRATVAAQVWDIISHFTLFDDFYTFGFL